LIKNVAVSDYRKAIENRKEKNKEEIK